MFIISLLIALTGNNFSNVFFGFRHLEPDSRSFSMGGTFLTNKGASSVKGNPAGLTKKELYLGLSPLFYYQTYTKLNSTPLANSFNSYTNPSLYFSYIPETRKFGFGVGYYNFIDFSYKIKELFFQGTQQTKEIITESIGSVNAIGVSFSYNFRRFLLGIGVDTLQGSRSFSKVDYNLINNTATTLEKIEYPINATTFKLGTIVDFENTSLGFIYRSGFKVSTDTFELNYPAALGFGLSYMPNDATQFSINFITSDFSNYISNYKTGPSTTTYQRVDEIRVGVETYAGETPIRFGIRFEPVYYEKRQQYVFLTGGSSVSIGFGFIDAGISYGRADFLTGSLRTDDVIFILNLGFRKEL
ncbi:MAG: hypothetical protein NZ870_01890 [bacterium]|nr:hypothetical protein [bacterium]